MKLQYKFAKDGAELSKMISSTCLSAKKLRDRIQVTAVAILYHAYKHGDYTGAAQLVDGLSDTGVRREALVQFFVSYGGLVLNTDKETKEEQPFNGWAGPEHIKERFEEAKVTYWDTTTKEKDPYKVQDLQESLVKLIGMFTKHDKAISEGKFVGRLSYGIKPETMEQLVKLSQRQTVETGTEEQVAEEIGALEALLSGGKDEEEGIAA